MNYLAHATPLLASDSPYAVAGVAVPDWLGVAAKRVKCRTKHAEPWLDAADERLSAIARGVARHHADDAWFHESRAFTELSLELAKALRRRLGEQTAMRPWFVGHILVEMLLDAVLEARHPGTTNRYYDTLDEVEANVVQEAVKRMTGHDVPRLAEGIDRFRELRFLFDYRTDEGLLTRLNQVLARVRLDPLPDEILSSIGEARSAVDLRFQELLAPPASPARVA